MRETTTDKLIPDTEVAEAYGISTKSVMRWAESGRIPRPVVRRNKFVRWSQNEVQADIQAMREAAKQEAMT